MRAAPILTIAILAVAARSLPASPAAPDAQAAPDSPRKLGGEIKPPRKLVNVSPQYPADAKRARVEGAVVLECTIDTQGRVAAAKVVRSIPLLDQAALDAVKQWVYTPTLLKGRPVPVIMTVTVNFRLSGETSPAGDGPPPSGEKIADMKRLLRIALAATFDMVIDVYRQAKPELPASFWERFREEFTSGEILDGIAGIYAKNILDEDVKPLLAFYESDSARRFFAAQPQILKESAPLLTEWGQRTFERLQRESKPSDQTTS